MEAHGPPGPQLDPLALDTENPNLLFDMPVVCAGKAVVRRLSLTPLPVQHLIIEERKCFTHQLRLVCFLFPFMGLGWDAATGA